MRKMVPLQEGQKPSLVLRLHGLATQYGEPGHVRWLKALENALLDLGGEGLACREVPLHGIEAALAVMAASGDEQRGSHADAVGDVAVLDLRVVHALVLSRKGHGSPHAPVKA